MTIIGFAFTKITAQRHGPSKGKLAINRKCNPTSVEKITIAAGQTALKYGFEFEANYEPKVAEMRFEGHITQLIGEEEADKIVKGYEEKNFIPPATLEKVMNGILSRAHIEALIMAKELNIPPPVQLPKVRVQATKTTKEKPAEKEE